MAYFQPKSYSDIVIDYCKCSVQFLYNDLLAIVSNPTLPNYRVQFTEIMDGLSTVLTKSKDCKILVTALGLLTDFANVGNDDVKENWRTPTRITLIQNLKSYTSLHWFSSSCGKCDGVRETSAILEKRFSPETQVSPQVTDVGSVNCPKCGTFVYIYREDASAFLALAQCKSEKCGFSFCQLCHREYHGLSDCLPEAQAMETEKVGLQQNDGNKIAFGDEAKEKPSPASPEKCSEKLPKSEIAPQSGESSFGAMATKYELDFYKPDGKGDSSAKDCFAPDEIASAFSRSLSEFKGASSYPWDSSRHQSYKDYGRPYQSLQDGNWVEDEILEKAMKGFIQKEKIDDLVGVLPSFLVNFSARKNGNEFARILKEEKVLEKEILLSLVNTDMSGPGGHWILATIFLSKKTILLQDSSRVISSTFYQKFYFYLLHLLHVAYSSKAEEFIPSNWRLNFSLDSMQQENAYDCGPLAVANAYSNVMKNEQLDQRPKSASLRSWIHDCASKYKTPKDTKNKIPNAETPSNRSDEKQFTPTGLRVQYGFIQGKKFIK